MTDEQRQETPVEIPYFLHEGEAARWERTTQRLTILCGILLAVLIGSNVAWLAYFH